MSLATVGLTETHAEEAARLVRNQMALLRRDVPELPESCDFSDRWTERIVQLARRGGGVVVVEGRRLLGFIGAFPISYGGRRSMLSPEWGHGVATDLSPDLARRVYEALYTSAATIWSSSDVETHIVALLAHDSVAPETLSWLGFGRVVCDAVRSLAPVSGDPGRGVRRAHAGDAVRIAELERALRRHHDSSPVFLSPRESGDAASWEKQIADPSSIVWVADQGTGPMGYLLQGPASDDSCDLIVDPGTSSITGIYVAPEMRGNKVAAALLAQAVEWAREQGYARLATDFETANVLGVRFWLSHFRPIVVSWARTIRANPKP